jgi:hypothetical protein
VIELPFTEVLGRLPMLPAPAHDDTKRRRELLAAVAEEIKIARTVMEEARATLARSRRRQSPGSA